MFTADILFWQVTLYSYSNNNVNQTLSACSKQSPGFHYEKIMFGKIMDTKPDYYVGFYCNGPIPKLTRKMGYPMYMMGIAVSKYKNFPYRSTLRWETGPTGISSYDPKLDSIWHVKSDTFLSFNIQFGTNVSYQYIIKYINHSFVIIKKWEGPYTKIWIRAGHLNVAMARMVGMIPNIYTFKNNQFTLTPIQKHSRYFIREAQMYYQIMHGVISPGMLAVRCDAAVQFANIARDYTLGEDACLFAKNKILQRRNLHAGGGKHGPPTPADIAWALRHINRRLKNIKKAHHLT